MRDPEVVQSARPFHPDPNHYKPVTVTGAPASSFELALTDPNFKFPQVWRTNLAVAVGERLPLAADESLDDHVGRVGVGIAARPAHRRRAEARDVFRLNVDVRRPAVGRQRRLVHRQQRARRLLGVGSVGDLLDEGVVAFEPRHFAARGDADTSALAGISRGLPEWQRAVKLQKRNNRGLYTKAAYNKPYDNENSFGPTYGAHREALEFGWDDYVKLKRYCDEIGVTFFATAFDFDSADFLARLDVPAFKIASGDLKSTPLLTHVARFGKPVILYDILSAGAVSYMNLAEELIAQWRPESVSEKG